MVRFIRAIAALGVLLALVAGVPVLLIGLVGNPYPGGGLAELGMLSDAAVLGLLAVIGWLFWAQVTACVLWELPAAVRGAAAPRLPIALGGQQRLVRLLVHSVVAIGVSTAVAAPGALQHAEAATSPTPYPQGTITSSERGPAARAEGQAAVRAHTAHPADLEVLPTVTVRTGDTLWGLAEQHLGAGERWREIADLNRGRDLGDGAQLSTAENLRVGWRLRLPADEVNVEPAPVKAGASDAAVVVQPGDSLSGIAAEHLDDAAAWPQLYEANRAVVGADPDLILPGQVLRLPGAATPAEAERPGEPGTKPDGQPDAATGDGVAPGQAEAPPGRPETVQSPAPAQQAPGAHQREDRSQEHAPAPHTPTAPTRDSARETARETAGSATDTRDQHGDQQDGVTALRALLASAVCLSGGAFAMLLAGRRRQVRARRSGRSIAATPAELVAVERAVIEVGSEVMETSEFVDLALRHLAASLRVAGLRLPNLSAAVIGQAELAVLFAEPVSGPAPQGWGTAGDGQGWTLARDTILEAELREQPAPYPALVSVGVDSDGRTWLLDLEAAGVFGVAGDAAQVEDLVRFLVAELALNAWAEGTEVMLIGGFAPETVRLNPSRIRLVDAETAERRGVRMARDAHESAQNLGMDLLELRRDAVAIDSTGPVVLIVPGQMGDGQMGDGHAGAGQAGGEQAGAGQVGGELVDAVRGVERSRVVVVHEDEMPTVELTGDGMAYLPGWGVTLTPFLLPAQQAIVMADLMAAVRQTDDVPMPVADDATPIGRVTRADGALREEFTVPRAGRWREAGSLLPEPDEIYLAAAATTPADLAALAPSVPAQVREEIEALDPGLDADLLAWTDPDARRPRVQVLGPIDVESWGMRKEEVANLGGTIEFIVYLACQEHGVTPERAAVALGWSEATVHNRARDARRMLGDRPDGEPWLPEAPKSATAQQRGVATYELHPEVLIAADLFGRLRKRAQGRGEAGLKDLVAALGLVTGRPFDRLRKKGYGWLAENPVDDHLSFAVVDVAHLVVVRSLAAGDTATARWACEIAINAAPDEDKPRLDLAAVTEAEGGSRTAVDDVVAEQVIDRVDADPTARTEQVIEQRGWLAS